MLTSPIKVRLELEITQFGRHLRHRRITSGFLTHKELSRASGVAVTTLKK